MKGKGAYYLRKNLSSIFIQNVKPFEVVISDHSSDDLVENEAKSWSNYLNIKYFRNTENVGNISANLNNCIQKAKGDILDFMLQDDFYYLPDSLQNRVKILGDSPWSVTSTIHYSVEQDIFYWHLIPEYRSDIYLGFNSIGSPSLLTMKKDDSMLFDERLFMLTDCDYYQQLFEKHGLPQTSKQITVVSCIWEGQSQKSVSDEKLQSEIKIVKEKYESR